MAYKPKQYSAEEIKQYQEFEPTFGLTKSEALTYAAKMGASDSIRGLQQMGSELFGFDETVEELKKADKKLQAILENPEYGNAAMGTFLSSAIIADPIGWLPIFGTVKKAKNIFDFAKYGAMAGGIHSGMGYVSEEAPGLIGEKQSRLENTLLGVGAGSTLGTIAPSTANLIQLARGKKPIYGLTKDISYTTTEEVPVTVKRPKKKTIEAKQVEYYGTRFTPPRPRADPIDATRLINFEDTKPTINKRTNDRFYKGFIIKNITPVSALDKTVTKAKSKKGKKLREKYLNLSYIKKLKPTKDRAKKSKFKLTAEKIITSLNNEQMSLKEARYYLKDAGYRTSTIDRLLRPYKEIGKVKSKWAITLPGVEIPEKSFKSLKQSIAYIDKNAVQNARRNLKINQANLDSAKELKLTKLEKEELAKSIEVGKSYRDRRVGQLEPIAPTFVEQISNINKNIKDVRRRKLKALKELEVKTKLTMREFKEEKSKRSLTHRVSDQKEFPFFLWHPDTSKSYRRGMRFKTFDDAKRNIFIQQRKATEDIGGRRIEIHTGSPSKINRGPDSKTLKQAGTFKSFANEYENSRLSAIKSWDDYIKTTKEELNNLKATKRDAELKLAEEARGPARGPSEGYYEGRFSNNRDYDEAIELIVKENSKEGSNKYTGMNPVLKFYQDNGGKALKNLVFNNAGSSLVGFGAGIGTYNAGNRHDSSWTERLAFGVTAGLAGAAGVNGIGRFKLKGTNELVSERMSKLFIDDYGMPASYKNLREELQINQNSFALKFLNLAEEATDKLNKNERKLFYRLMTGELDDLSNLSEEGLNITSRARVLIKDMGQKYVDEGLLDRKIFEKNAGIYLHRSYLKYVDNPKFKKELDMARKITLIGENLRPRGVPEVRIKRTVFNNPKSKYQREKYYILNDDGKSKTVRVKRDFTKEERLKAGEYEDLSFAIAETGRLMSTDVATAKFFRQVSEDKNIYLTKKQYAGLSADIQEDFISVSNENISGTKAKKYGKLAGGYLKREVYNDITKMYKIRLKADETNLQAAVDGFDKLQKMWKLSKTAWNPATHFNNTISNFLLLDFADTKVEMLVKAAKEFKLGTKSELLNLGKQHGIFEVDILSRELKDLGSTISRSLEKTADYDNVVDAVNHSNKLYSWARKIKAATLGKLEDAYQFEDQVFRMAVFMDRLNKGFDTRTAAREAKKWFIDYNINAPAINAMKRWATPFISYTYRVMPLLAEAAILRPHKFAKWAAIGYGINEIGKELGGGNEELERVTMRDELSKKIWGIPFMPHRLIKLGWDSNAGDSQYLDIGRLVPGGDIFDQREGKGFKIPGLPAPAQPGGLLVDIPLIMGTRKNPFTGQDLEGVGLGGPLGDFPAILKGIAQNLTPNVAILPGSYAWKKMQTATEQEIPFIGEKREPFHYAPGSKYAAKYSPLEALAFTLGIKLRPQNTRVNERLKQVDYNMQVQALKKQRSKIKKDFRNRKNIFTAAERDKELKEIDLMLLRLAAEFEVYKRAKSKARAKDVRLPKATGGLIEGKEVPFTKENPAERINPYTGDPYEISTDTKHMSLLNTLRDRVSRIKKADGGEIENKKSIFVDKKDIILNTLKEQGSGDRFYYTDEEIENLESYAYNVALAESDHIVNAIQKVGGKEAGPGRGKYQYEISVNELDSTLGGSGANKTALQRYKNFHEMYNIPLTERDQEIIDEIDNNLDFSTLSESEQDAIFYANQAMGKLSLEDLVTGKISHNDAWYTTHYKGTDESKRNYLNDRIK